MSSVLPKEERKQPNGQKYFSRQENVPGWSGQENQSKIYNQTALILGTGGIGSSIAFCLARLGIKKIILTDFDVVEESNLNRQVLFSAADVGSRKVDAAKKNLESQHAISGRTEIVALHCDLIEEWGTKIVPLFSATTAHHDKQQVQEQEQQHKQISAIFNGCDWGESFDLFVAKFCREQNIPYCSGASYAHHADFEVFSSSSSSKSSSSCLGCRLGTSASLSLVNSISNRAAVLSSTTNDQQNHHHRHHLCFLPQDSKPETGFVGSSVLPCMMAAELVVNYWINKVVVFVAAIDANDNNNNNNNNNENNTNNTNIYAMMELGSGLPELFSFPIEKEPNCAYCSESPPRNLQLFSLAFGGEPVVLGSAAAAAPLTDDKKSSTSTSSSTSYTAPIHETESERKSRIEKYRERITKLLSNNNDNIISEEEKVKQCLPNLQGHPSSVDRSNFLPCCPTVPFVIEGEEDVDNNFFLNASKKYNNEKGTASSATGFITAASNPLIKSKTGTVHGIRSGLRSAILPPSRSAIFSSSSSCKNFFTKFEAEETHGSRVSSTYAKYSFNDTLRLKGCGCVTHDTIENTKRQAFPLASLDPPELKQFMPDAPDRWEIRGCQFLDTGIREAVVTSRLAELLFSPSSKSSSSCPSSFILGNYPVALWKYGEGLGEEKETDKKSVYGNIGKYCGVFQTLGDKRAEMHLLNGLEILLAASMKMLMTEKRRVGGDNTNVDVNDNTGESLMKALAEKIKTQIFEPKGRLNKETGKVIPTWSRTKQEPLIENAKEEINAKLGELREIEQFIFGGGNNSPSSTSSSFVEASFPLLKNNLHSQFANLWRTLLLEENSNETSASPSSSSVFAHIYDRLGYEIGFFHGALNASNHSWGLFFDHNPCEPHNNAHPNNYVVVAASLFDDDQDDVDREKNKNNNHNKEEEEEDFFFPRQYLAAVDFDMAYAKDEFVSNFTGLQDEDLFSSNLEWEQREMESVLGGNDQQSTGIVQGVLEKRLNEMIHDNYNNKDETAAASTKSLLEEYFEPLRILLRDLIVCSMKKGYQSGVEFVKNKKAGKEVDQKQKLDKTNENIRNEKLMHCAVKLALILTDGMNC